MRLRVTQPFAALVVVAATMAAAPPVEAAGAPPPAIIDTQTVGAPDAGASNFANSASHPSVPRAVAMDTARLVVPADLGGNRVVYVFDLAGDDTWAYSATITAPTDSTDSWGDHVAVAGSIIAVADPGFVNAGGENYGRVHVYDLQAGTWNQSEVLSLGGSFVLFGRGVWLGGDGLVVREGIYCDGDCGAGRWYFYERGAGTSFALSFSRRGALDLDVGVDGPRMAVARPGFDNVFSCDPVADSNLIVTDTGPNPATVLHDEVVPLAGSTCQGSPDDWFRTVDISGDVLATEICCGSQQRLRIQRFNGTQYVEESSLPIGGLSDGLAAVPSAVFRADFASAQLHAYVFDGTIWQVGPDLALPSDIDAGSPVVAAGPRVAVVGDGNVTVLTIGARVPTCAGRVVTVDLSAGEVPTAGPDVILGTAGHDVIDARAGDDVVCSLGGNDVVVASDSLDLVFGGDGNDILVGGVGTDVLVGEGGRDLILGLEGNDILAGLGGADIVLAGPGNDFVVGGDDADLLVGNGGADVVLGDAGDDLVMGGPGNDALTGGPGADVCNGGAGTDTATGCETTVRVP